MTAVQSMSSTTNKVLGGMVNAWYVAAWDHEVTRTPMSHRIGDRALALYRTEDGKAAALADACWHRLAPLSMGRTLANDQIQCPYHGVVYTTASRCVAMPAQESLNPSATVMDQVRTTRPFCTLSELPVFCTQENAGRAGFVRSPRGKPSGGDKFVSRWNQGKVHQINIVSKFL